MTFIARRWHAWLSIVLVLPMFIVAVTTFFMAHEKSLGLKEIEFGSEQHAELKSVLYISDSNSLLATKGGVYQLTENRLEAVEPLRGMEIRRFHSLPDRSILAAGKQGLWRGTPSGKWKRIHAGDIHALSVLPAGRWHIVVKDGGLITSNDEGVTWQTDENVLHALERLPAEQGNLGKLMQDLHTGKALFGKNAEWIWIDILGLALAFLCLTGVWVWWRAQQLKT